jgi:hypothetical protein
MKIIGIHGPKGVGKDTLADVFVREFGYKKIGFADALYEEVAEAFGVSITFLRNRETKESPSHRLVLYRCLDPDFVAGMRAIHGPSGLLREPRSPRWLLEQWGTEYRRVQAEDYWVDKMWEKLGNCTAPAVIPDVRFPNEIGLINDYRGLLIRLARDGFEFGGEHESDSELPETEKQTLEIENATLSDLGYCAQRANEILNRGRK